MSHRSLLSVPLLAMALATGTAAPAGAAPPPELTGTFQLTGFQPTGGSSPGQGGKVNLFTAVSTSAIEGGLEGTSVNTLTCVEVVDRGFSCHGTATFEGTVLGAAATSTSRLSFRCSWVTAVCTGRSVAYESTGSLAGQRGLLMFEQDAVTGAGTYTLRLLGG